MNTVQRSAANCPPLSWTGSVISLFWKQKTDNLRAYVVILDLEYMYICDRQSTTLCASVYEVLCPTLCLYGCIFFVYYVCITWACIFVYVCYPLLELVYSYVVLLCYICYTEFKKTLKKTHWAVQLGLLAGIGPNQSGDFLILFFKWAELSASVSVSQCWQEADN